MQVVLQMRALLLILAAATALMAEVDVREVIRRAVAADQRNWKAARNYTYSERVNLRYLDSQGLVKSQEVKSQEVLLLEGSPYRRLVARDDRPLPSAESDKEQEKLARSISERRSETAVQRAQRLAEYARRPEWQREAWRELPEAFDFRLAAEQVWDGRGVYAILATPRQGYQPTTRTAKMLLHLQIKLWVDMQDYHLVKAEVEVIDTIWVGLFLVRVAKGSRAVVEQTVVDGEVWLPSHTRVVVSARLGLLKVLRIDQEVSYSQCLQCQVASSMVAHTKAN